MSERRFKTEMTPAELREAIFRLYGDRWGSIQRLADELGISRVTVGKYLSGEIVVTGPVRTAIELMLELRVSDHSRMSAQELCEAIDTLYDDPKVGVRHHRLANELGISSGGLANWLYGRNKIPRAAKVAINLLIEKKRLQDR